MKKTFRIYLKDRVHSLTVSGTKADFVPPGVLEIKDGSETVAAFPSAHVQGWKIEEPAQK